MAVVYSYIRFSSKPQEQGDSIRRQKSMGDNWMSHHPEHRLDDSLRDLGISAFRGANLDRSKGLGKFIALVRKEEIEPGSILMLESIDRFSRMPAMKVAGIFNELVECGIRILTLEPEEITDSANINDMGRTLSLILRMQLGYEESRRKGQRVSAAWQAKRQRAATNGACMTRNCPAWLLWNDKARRWDLKPGAKKALEFIFTKTCEGVGQKRLIAQLQDQYQPLTGTQWTRSIVSDILKKRLVLGELAPLRRSEKPSPVIADYYPKVIADDLWYRARAATRAHLLQKGPNGQFVNLFTGIVWGSDGFPLHVQTSVRKACSTREKKVERHLISAGHRAGVKTACVMWVPYEKCESYILSLLYQIKPDDLLPGKQPDGTAAKRGALAGIESRLAELESALTGSAESVPELLKAIKTLSITRDSLKREIEALEAAGATAKAKPLESAQSLIEAIERTPEAERHGLRLKLRALIAAVVSRVEIAPYRVGKKVEATLCITFREGAAVGCLRGDTRDGLDAANKLSSIVRKVPAGVLASARLVSAGPPPTIAVRLTENQSGEPLAVD